MAITNNSMANLLKELYDDATYLSSGIKVTDDLVKSFSPLEKLVHAKEIKRHLKGCHSLSDMLSKDNPFLRLINKSSSSYVPVPIKFGK